MLKRLFMMPGKNMLMTIPVTLLLGFIAGSLVDTGFLKNWILIGTFFMIFPTMIGFKLKTALDLSHGRVVLWSILINFILIPLVAWGIGLPLSGGNPQIYAGLAIAALLPTSGMTISWTMISKGNVTAAVKIVAISLILGAVLAPFYLKWMVGQYLPIDLTVITRTILIIVFLPMVLGQFTTKWLLRKYGQEGFTTRIKPLLPAVSVWAMISVIFSSISMKARVLLQEPDQLINILFMVVLFYILNFGLATLLARWLFNREDGLALVFGTALRNLSIALGIAVTTFGAEAALAITVAFVLQVQAAAWYGKLADRYPLFRPV
ncbi:MAG: arsenic resistance protein [Bacillaceae bacterium]|nr:arsenic resistance protein [Bacillaceae bacterium]